MSVTAVHYGPFSGIFSQVVQATCNMARSYSVQPELARQNFYFNVCSYLQEPRDIPQADWDTFGREFSKIAERMLESPTGTSQRDEFLKWVYQIETRAKKCIQGLPDTLKPVLAKGKNAPLKRAESKSAFSQSQEAAPSQDANLALFSRADFAKTEPLLTMVTSQFKEARTIVPEVDFGFYNTPGAFSVITAFLHRDESYQRLLSRENLEQVMNFAKMYELKELFEACVQSLQTLLSAHSEDVENIPEALKKLLTSLIFLTQEQELPRRRRMRRESEEGALSFNMALSELRSVYAHLQVKTMAPEEFENFVVKARKAEFLQDIALSWAKKQLSQLFKKSPDGKSRELGDFFNKVLYKPLHQKENSFLFPLWNVYLELKQKQKFGGEIVVSLQDHKLHLKQSSLKMVVGALHFVKNLKLMPQLKSLEIVIPFVHDPVKPKADKVDGVYLRHVLNVGLFSELVTGTKQLKRMPKDVRAQIPQKITFVLSPKGDGPDLARHSSARGFSAKKLVKDCTHELEEYKKSGKYKADIASRQLDVNELISCAAPIDFSMDHF